MQRLKNIQRTTWLLFLCWLIYTVSLLGKVNYAANITQIESFYKVSHADAGMASTFYFFAYGIGQVVNGILCKKYNLKYVIFGGLFISGLMNFLVAFLGNFAFIKYAWLVNGFALSVLWPCLIRLLSETMPKKEMVRASVAMGTTTAVGTVIIYSASALFVAIADFTWAFYMAAIALPLVGMAWLVFYNRLAVKVEDYEVYKEGQGQYSMEEDATDSEIMGVKRLRATAQFFCGDYYHLHYGHKPKTVYTNMLDYNEQTIGDGIVSVGNTLIFPYANTRSDQKVPISLLCPLREYAVKTAIQNNAVNTKNLYFIEEENVCLYVFDKGDIVYLVCVNFVDDDYQHLHIQSPYAFDDIKIFTPDNGTVRYVSYVCENGKYLVNHTLKAQESYVLVGYKREKDKPNKK